MRITAFGLIVALCASGAVFAQDSIVGRYTGSFDFQTNQGLQKVGVTVVIDSVEDGRVKGTATMGGRACAGDYPVEGTLKGSELAVRSTRKGGPAGDCSFAFRGTAEGSRLVGRMGKYDVELRR